jgi:hypothetical protein
MNWRRLYATLQIYGVVGGVSAGGAGCWAFLIAGGGRMLFRLSDDESMLLIGLPLFISLTICFIRLLPKHLRKAGMLSDEPEKFGPWFKKDPEL